MSGALSESLPESLLEVLGGLPGASLVTAGPQGPRGAGLVVAGSSARPLVAVGLAAAGRTPVVGLDEVPAHWPPGLAVTSSVAVAAAGEAAGRTVLLPAWLEDVAGLAGAALADSSGAVLLWEGGARPPPRDPRPVGDAGGRVRTLRRGDAGLVVGAGSRVPVLHEAAAVLAARGVEVTAVAWQVCRRGSGPSVADVAGAALVGRPALVDDRWDGAGVRPVPLEDPGIAPRDLADLLLAALPAATGRDSI